MKRKCLFFLVCVITVMLCACGDKKNQTEPDKSEDTELLQTESAIPESEMTEDAEPTIEPTPTPAPFVSQWVSETGSKVYMTTDISATGMMAVYQALGQKAEGENVAVKLTTGEPESNYLKPELIGELVKTVNGTLVECNTAYAGSSRNHTEIHLQVAKDHGYLDIANVDIMDDQGSYSIPVNGGIRLTENFVGATFPNYDYMVVLSHFKGHEMAGFGGAIKNISIGLASVEGKRWIHSGGKSKKTISGVTSEFEEAMAEAGKGVVDSLNGKILYINVMNNLSTDCDCNPHPSEPRIQDIGILASLDPVALDQACVDLIYACPDKEGTSSLIKRMEMLDGVHTLEHGQEIGLGSRFYQLISID